MHRLPCLLLDVTNVKIECRRRCESTDNSLHNLEVANHSLDNSHDANGISQILSQYSRNRNLWFDTLYYYLFSVVSLDLYSSSTSLLPFITSILHLPWLARRSRSFGTIT
jgi:hypothetical protein